MLQILRDVYGDLDVTLDPDIPDVQDAIVMTELPEHPPIFCYGSLMCNEVLQALLKRVPRKTVASVSGFTRYAIKDDTYPAMVRDAASAGSTEGFLLSGLTAEEITILDKFEDTEYERAMVDVNTGNEGGNNTTALAYVWPFGSERLSPDLWDPEAFRTAHLTEFVAMCEQWVADGCPAC